MSKREDRRNRLYRRIEFLEERIKTATINGTTYDKAELSALKWILNEEEILFSLKSTNKNLLE